MKNRYIYIILFCGLLIPLLIRAESDRNGSIRGTVRDADNGTPLPGANISVTGHPWGASSDTAGTFILSNIPAGSYLIEVQYMGYHALNRRVDIAAGKQQNIKLEMTPKIFEGETVVVTGSRTEKSRRETPAIVNVLDRFIFNSTQSLCLSEGLNYQPGVRLEVDCQTCNYTQIRMNGLGGSYAQILIDNRPVFSPLNGLYGLDQIPTNMIDRVEVLRGGGSALFGGNAVAGTVNIITREPRRNEFSATANVAMIDGVTPDHTLTLNSSIINNNRSAGVRLFGILRDRDAYDNNRDGFSEIPRTSNSSFGLRGFYKPTSLSKITIEGHNLNEERQGGDRIDGPPHEAEQSEFRDHKIIGGGLTYEQYISSDLHQLSVYVSGQSTDRVHYTGLDRNLDAYGTTDNMTFVAGTQYNHNFLHLFGNTSGTLTMGAEFTYDDVDDRIPDYQLFTQQLTRQLGLFVQKDWQMSEKISTVLGLRVDHHNLIDDPVLNPRLNILFDLTRRLQWRGSASTGFRAPQAFDADLHIAFAGGGISYVRVSEDLTKERSVSYSTSLDYNYGDRNLFFGITVQAFYTRLRDAFILEEVDADAEGNTVLERKNGSHSTVRGVSAEVRLNIDNLMQLGANMTVQRSRYDRAVAWSADVEPTVNYLRTPDVYGSFTTTLYPFKRLETSLSGVYTGPMDVPHLAGYIESDRLVRSPSFLEANLKISYRLTDMPNADIDVFLGIQNILNAYQSDFDKYKDRDSNYVYGPARPRTYYSGIQIGL